MPNDNELIILKNSNPLNKYPVDAEQLNHNFNVLQTNQGTNAVKQIIESTGQIYSPIIDNQLAMAVAQYVFSSTMFDEKGTGNTFVLYPKDGFSAPYRYTTGMVVNFISSRTNTGAMTLQVGSLPKYPVYSGMNDVPAAYIPLNTIISFRFMGTYWVQITAGQSSGSSSGSSGSGTGEVATSVTDSLVHDAIITAGIEYDPTDTSILSKAIAQYVARSLYSCTLNGTNYVLNPYGNQAAPKSYTEGMLVSFIADTNSPASPSISIGDLSQTFIFNYEGSLLPANQITAGEFVTLRFDGSNFILISQHHYTMSLQDGNEVSEIHTVVNQETPSNRALLTENAVKSYVDTAVKGTQTNMIVSGYTVGEDSAAMHTVGDYVIQLFASANTANTYDTTHTNPDNIITSGTSSTTVPVNAVSKRNTLYWESDRSGFAVDNIKRAVLGEAGSKYVGFSYTAQGDLEYLSNPPAPSYFGFKNVPQTTKWDTLRIKHTDSNHTPSAILVQVNTTANLDADSWLTMCDAIGEQGAQVADTSYGDLTSRTTDSSGYYNITIPAYIINGDAIEVFAPTASYAFRVVAYIFNNQFASTELINTPGYNPNNDVSDETVKYTWQISDIIVGNTIQNVPPLILSYPDGYAESVTTPIYFSLLNSTEAEPTKASVISLANGRYVIYKLANVDSLYSVNKTLVFTQTQQPPASADNAGAVWINIGTVPYETFICTEITDTEGNVTGYEWQANNLMLLGGFDIVNNKITKTINYRYGNALVEEYPMTATFTATVDHNFGSDVTVESYLVCTANNNGYIIGEQIILDHHQLSVYTPPPVGTEIGELHNITEVQSTAGSIGTTTLSYYLISNTNITTRIDAYNLRIINRATHSLVALPDNSWSLRIYINKD